MGTGQTQDEQKVAAAKAALEHVEPGMKLGIGTGSTAEAFVDALAERVDAGFEVVGVPTSEHIAQRCMELGVPLTSLDETPRLDLAVDGADEIGPDLALIKGGGGALLREKIVAHAADRMIVIADASKHVEMLGAYPLPIEVVAFGSVATCMACETVASRIGLTGDLVMREGRDGPYRTDGGNYILDASFGSIPDPEALAAELRRIPGVVEHGLFIGLADVAIIATLGGTQILGRDAPAGHGDER